MFVVLLTFSAQKDQAGKHMQGHKDWLQRGFDDGVFLAAGGLAANRGGAILAHNTTRTDLEARTALDPFVTAQVVNAEFIEFTPSRVDPRVDFLLG